MEHWTGFNWIRVDRADILREAVRKLLGRGDNLPGELFQHLKTVQLDPRFSEASRVGYETGQGVKFLEPNLAYDWLERRVRSLCESVYPVDCFSRNELAKVVERLRQNPDTLALVVCEIGLELEDLD